MPGLKADPLRELLALQQQITRRMEERFGTGARGAGIDPIPETAAGAWTPPMDVYETESGFVLKAELPGFSEKDVTLTIEGRMLTLRGVRKGPRENAMPRKSKRSSRVESGNAASVQEFHRMEREYGAFQRTFTLPRPVEAAGAVTRWKDGVLEVTVSKQIVKPASKPRNRR